MNSVTAATGAGKPKENSSVDTSENTPTPKLLNTQQAGLAEPSSTELGDLSADNQFKGGFTKTQCFGTLDIEGGESYFVFLRASRTGTVWVLTDKQVYDRTGNNTGKSTEHVVAILKMTVSGRSQGYGKVFILTRLLDVLNSMVSHATTAGEIKPSGMFNLSCNYTDQNGAVLRFSATVGGSRYKNLFLYSEGFTLDIAQFRGELPFKMPSLLEVQDSNLQSAIISGLGVNTFALLRKRMGDKLDWYDHKDYRMVTSLEEFNEMMSAYLDCVQAAYDKNATVLTAIDTETTGLNMVSLPPDNPNRDFVVAIPFGWEKDKAYVICTQMYYFNNVPGDAVYPLFHKLFSRNADYTFQDIELDFNGKHYKFNRKNIMTVGANVGFDTRAFLCHDVDTFFDEDIQVMHYNLATDYAQGRNSLKWMTHHYIGDQTLELDDLFGKQHKDKFRFLTDPDLVKVYGGADADYPRILWRLLRKLTSDNLYKMYRKYDITTVHRTARATWLGMPIDEKSVKRLGEAQLNDLSILMDFIYRYAYAANRGNIDKKAEQLAELLGVGREDLQQSSLETEDHMYRYKFTPANHKRLLFDILGYPIIKMSEKTHEPALDKYVLKKLAEVKREQPLEVLRYDIRSSNGEDILISKEDFNRSQYPLAQVFLKYSELNKEYTAYFKPIMTKDLDQRMFYTFSLQRAATRRILSPGQTMKGSLKKLVIAPPGKLFFCFDASQIEYRHMASLAYIQTKSLLKSQFPDSWEQKLGETGISRIFNMMRNKEADYHIETASMMTGLPQFQIDHDTRKMYKSVGFGIPYGLGDKAMCESLFKQVTPEYMQRTKEVLADYRRRQSEIIRLLETARDSAFVPAPISEGLRHMLQLDDEQCVGIVNNFVGFYRLFFLDNVSKSRYHRIRNQAGNCLIQGGAAELFRRMIYNFYQGCITAGIGDSVEWLMLVHDEVDSIVSADIDVCKLIKTVHESCTLRYQDHIPYYVGIGLGYNWGEAKDDAAELPVIMVDRLVEAYDAGEFSIPSDGRQPEHLMLLKRHYFCDRIHEELSKIIPNIGVDFEWSDRAVDVVNTEFQNYIVRAYLPAFCTKEDYRTYGKKKVPLNVQLERWLAARKEYGFGIDFLQEKLVDARDELLEMQIDTGSEEVSEDIDLALDSSDFEFTLDDLSIDLLDNTSEEEEMLLSTGQWVDEQDLFDPAISADDIEGLDEDRSYKYFGGDRKLEGFEDYEINANPTNSFDLYVSKKYVRKYTYKTGENIYSVLLFNTRYKDDVSTVAQLVRQNFSAGSDTVLVCGSSIKKVSGVSCTPEVLDALDKSIVASD